MSTVEGDAVSQRRGGKRERARRRRRSSVRVPREYTRRSALPDQTGTTSTAETLLPPDLERFAAFHLGVLPVDVMPLYALLIPIYHAITRRPNYPVVVASAQLVRALEHLGFEAELVPASILIAREGDEKHPMDIGAWKHPPVLRDDGTTDGHVAIWADSFRRCIDLGPCNHPVLLKSSSDSQNLVGPVVLPMGEGREKLLDDSRRATILRLPFVMCWTFIPQWKPYFDPILACNSSAIEDGGLALAKVAVDLLSAIAVYSDMSKFNKRYPWLTELLSGQADLPLPEPTQTQRVQDS